MEQNLQLCLHNKPRLINILLFDLKTGQNFSAILCFFAFGLLLYSIFQFALSMPYVSYSTRFACGHSSASIPLVYHLISLHPLQLLVSSLCHFFPVTPFNIFFLFQMNLLPSFPFVYVCVRLYLL